MAAVISADSACDLFPDLYRERSIEIVPLYISINGKSYRDVFEIGPDELFRDYGKTHVLPKTSAPPPADFFELFQKASGGPDGVVHLAMNSKFSASCQNARIAAGEFDDVHVVDTRTLSSAQGLLALRAADLRDEGETAAEIARRIELEADRVRAYVLLDSLEFAYRGGRATMLQMFGANLLKLRPCLLLDTNGDLSVCKKFRGNFAQVCREYARFVLSRPDAGGGRAFVTSTGMDSGLFEEIVKMVRESGKFDEVLTSRAGCTMTTHAGPNALVIFYLAG